MAENDKEQANPSESGAGQNAPTTPKFAVQRLYIKDSSFEAPDSPACFRENYAPKIDFNMGIKNAPIEGDLHEVVLTLTLDVKQNDKTMFLAEVQQAGIFQISGIKDDEELVKVLHITCPAVLFPYGREALDAMIVKGSFPAVMLSPINFDALFVQVAKQKAAGEAPKDLTAVDESH